MSVENETLLIKKILLPLLLLFPSDFLALPSRLGDPLLSRLLSFLPSLEEEREADRLVEPTKQHLKHKHQDTQPTKQYL